MQLETWQVVAGGVIAVFGQGGASWLVLKTMLNGTGARVQAIDKRTEEMQVNIATLRNEHGERLARIETKLEDR